MSNLKKRTKTSSAAKNPKAKPTHPKTSEMVNNAIKELKERNGSSLQAIKKCKVDAQKLTPFIRKYLKSAVESGALVHTKGKDASGSFKVEAKGAAKKPAKAKLAPKKKVAAKLAAKKSASPKKVALAKKAKPAVTKPSKAKNSANPLTKKPKARKPKAAPKAKSAAKKAAGQK